MFKGLHEQLVEKFYSISVPGFAQSEKNYLNFGLWDGGVKTYRQAAERLIARVGERIGLDTASEVLDVAAGMDAEPRYLREKFGCKKVTALDLTPGHVAIAKKRNADPMIEYVQGDAVSIHYRDAYSHVMAVEGIAHFKPRQLFLARAARALRPGGRLGLADICLGRTPENGMEQLLVRAAETVWLVPREDTETVRSYAEKLERKGFVDVDVEVVGGSVFPGYARDHWRPASWRELRKVRGSIPATAGLLMDGIAYGLHALGLLEYVIVSARKKVRHG